MGTVTNVRLRRSAGNLPAPHERVRLTRAQREVLLDIQRVWDRLALYLLSSDQLSAPWAVGITSSIPGEGKTTSSMGLAVALAEEAEGRVLLVEANVQEPSLAINFDAEPAPGLADYLGRGCDLETTLCSTSLTNLTIVPSGADRLLGSPASASTFSARLRRKLPKLLASWKAQFAYIILDLPAIFEDPNTAEMASFLDGVLLVVRSGFTPRETIAEAAQSLEASQLMGTIQVGSRSAIPRWLSRIIEE